MKIKLPEEWFKQAKYDLKTAEAMFDSKRYIYSVFMCHLSIEKALKGIYAHVVKENPAKTHNLNYLLKKIEEVEKIDIGEYVDFIEKLNLKSIPTRYPEDLQKMFKDYNKKNTKEYLEKTKGLLKCLMAKY
jgi:HEPN domain-containing protein